MFARRKPKPEDIEPLVPHGLVWQATDGANKEAEAAASPAAWPQRPSAPLPELIQKPPNDTPENSKPLNTPNAPEVLQWPIANSRHISIPLHAGDLSRAQKKMKVVHIRLENEPKKPGRTRKIARQFGRTVGRAARMILVIGAGRLTTLLRTAYLASTRVRLSFGKIRPIRENSTETRARRRLWGNMLLRRMPRAPVDEAGRTGGPQLVARIQEFASLLRIELRRLRMKEVKVRVHMPTFFRLSQRGARLNVRPSIRILLARLRAEWTLRRESLEHDLRFWNSMTWAVVCALLALGFASGVRHYATKSLPSRQALTRTVSTPSTVAHAAMVDPGRENREESIPVHVDENTALTKASLTEPIPPSKPSARVHHHSVTGAHVLAHRKRRTAEDDDFVARDTYVYYGSRSNSR